MKLIRLPTMMGINILQSMEKRILTQRLVCEAFRGLSTQELPICIRQSPRQQPRRLRSQRYLRWGSYGEIKRCKYVHLTEEQKLEILELNKNGSTQISLAKRFGVTQTAISYLINGKTKLRGK